MLGEGFTKPGSALAEGATLHAGSRPSAPNTHPSPNIAFKSYLGMSTKDIEVGPPSYDNHPEEEAAEAEEERLPLYGGFQYEHAGAHQDDLPTNAASPNEVRDFIVHVLVSRRQLPVDHARRIATRWTIGSGLEMRSYPASMYLELFGSEDGWILYREIKLMMHAEANRKFMHRYMSRKYTSMCHYAPLREQSGRLIAKPFRYPDCRISIGDGVQYTAHCSEHGRWQHSLVHSWIIRHALRKYRSAHQAVDLVLCDVPRIRNRWPA